MAPTSPPASSAGSSRPRAVLFVALFSVCGVPNLSCFLWTASLATLAYAAIVPARVATGGSKSAKWGSRTGRSSISEAD
eukprot:138299-Pyramimonas_sp.AAC.1